MDKFAIATILAAMLASLLTHVIDNRHMLFKGYLLQRKIVLWSDRVIPYEFHHSVNQNSQGTIRQAMDNWEMVTCITFVPRTNQWTFLRFRTDRPGCSSEVGRRPFRFFPGQDVILGDGCMHLQVVIHEIGHSLGFIHEHSRKDRDSVIEILWHNIQEDKVLYFMREEDDRRDVPYDVTSVMHYPPMDFSTKPLANTIVTKNPHHQRLIGSSQTLSFRDAKRANKMYSCNEFCPNLFNESQQCQNGGYLSPYKGNNSWCHCICPPETYGTYCENTRNADYYGPPICGGNVTKEQEIQTPGYPKRESLKDSCSWWIQAPPRKRVMVTFLDFSFCRGLPSEVAELLGRCLDERVEIRTTSMVEGNMYCGEDIKPGSNLASQGEELMIIITTPEMPFRRCQKTRGLKAKVSFID